MTRRGAAASLGGIAMVLALGVALLGWLLLRSPTGAGVHAEFASAQGLVVGNDVREQGAVVGTVRSITLTRQGTANVDFVLGHDAARPRADAVAAIEPADLLGDYYLALSPGTARAPLHGAIAAASTSEAPSLDAVLSAFSPSVRDGLGLLLVQGGQTLEDHGVDLARAAVLLRPALSAAASVSDSLAGQDAALSRTVALTAQAVGRVATHEASLGPLLDDLSRTLAATSSAAPALARSLALGAPALTTLRSGAGALSSLASAARPIAAVLHAEAPTLGRVSGGLAPLARSAGAAAGSAAPALERLGALLARGAGTISSLDGGLRALQGELPAIDRLAPLAAQAAPYVSQGFFADFADEATESGAQPLDPFADPTRAYWRGEAVLSCQTFGVPVAPGCMTQALSALGATRASGTPAPHSSSAQSTPTPAAATRPAVPGAATPPAGGPTQVSLPGLPPISVPPVVPTLTGAAKSLLDLLLGSH
ncbi:MAG TPA: MlaD family protein [Solirubrobacteraceae bacterium]|jgi:phospholipid/cholesterol/gamma-HCH transport system substrate-binding protein|nr:MlaD family protein [Solirubrobacteraceae bacterium]